LYLLSHLKFSFFSLCALCDLCGENEAFSAALLHREISFGRQNHANHLTLKNNCHNFKEIKASHGYATSRSVFVYNGIIGAAGAPIGLLRKFYGFLFM